MNILDACKRVERDHRMQCKTGDSFKHFAKALGAKIEHVLGVQV